MPQHNKTTTPTHEKKEAMDGDWKDMRWGGGGKDETCARPCQDNALVMAR